MGQRGITVLTKEHFDMIRVLKAGYPNAEDKFEYLWYGDQQKYSENKIVIAKYFHTKVTRLTSKKRRTKTSTQSERLFSGRSSMTIRYPRSGKMYKVRIRYKDGIAVLEPTKPNTAFWLVDKIFIDTLEVIDLNKIPHIRQIHNKKGKEIMANFRKRGDTNG